MLQKQKNFIKNTLAGYAIANNKIREIKNEELPHQTNEEAFDIYENLCDFYYSRFNKPDTDYLSIINNINHKLKLRTLFKKYYEYSKRSNIRNN
jgi:hypothetical protein